MWGWIVAGIIVIAVAALAVFGWPRYAKARHPGVAGMELPEEADEYSRRVTPLLPFQRSQLRSALQEHPPRGVLLDVGCGPGYLSADIARQFPALRVLGLDISGAMLHHAVTNAAARTAPVSYVEGDVEALPFATGSLDYVVSTFSLHHWPDASRGFREIGRVLKPDGHFVCLDLRRDDRQVVYWVLRLAELLVLPEWMRRRDGMYTSAIASYTPAELERMLRAAGFAAVNIRPGPGWMTIHADGMAGA